MQGYQNISKEDTLTTGLPPETSKPSMEALAQDDVQRRQRRDMLGKQMGE